MSDDKRIHYSKLLERLDQAIDAEYFLEASWIAYAVVEDRTRSTLKHSGGIPQVGPVNNRREMWKISEKITTIRSRLGAGAHETNLKATVDGAMLDKLSAWTDRRNRLVHKLADEVDDPAGLAAEITGVAKDGKELARELCAAVMRLKKLVSK